MALVGHRHSRLSIPFHAQPNATTTTQQMPVTAHHHHHHHHQQQQQQQQHHQQHHNQILAAAVSSTFYQPVIPQQDVQPDRPIGYGAFGVVWAVTDPRHGKRVALKKMPNVFHNMVSSRRVYRELRMLAHFKNDNVLSAHDILQPPHIDFFHEVYVLTELMQSDLHKIIVSPQPLSVDHVKVFLYQLLRGLKYLHSAHVIHRDLKPGNLLVNSNCVLKICDFGLARVIELDESQQMTQEVVTQYYRAPEILLGTKHYNESIDIWSVGCIFAELLSRRILFQAQTPLLQLDLMTDLLGTPTLSDVSTVCKSARNHVMRSPTKPATMTALYRLSGQATHEAVHLICRMLVFDPAKRITVVDALAHPYMEDGRLRYHSCMCRCCETFQGRRHFSSDLEPLCRHPFSYSFEEGLNSTQRIKEKLYKFIMEQQCYNSVPLCINPNSVAYKNFSNSHCAQASELPPSPHIWE